MKHFHDKINEFEKKLENFKAIKDLIDQLPYKVKEPVIYDSNIALVQGFKTSYGPNNEIILSVRVIFVSDELHTKDNTLIYRMVESEVAPEKLAPYTEAAKLLFSKG